MLRFIFLVLSLSVAGCAPIMQQQASDKAKQTMVGLDKERVLQCAGAPTSSNGAGATEVLRYDVGGHGSYSDGDTVLNCTVNVTLVNGIVSRVDYSGISGAGLFTPTQKCAEVVARCAS